MPVVSQNISSSVRAQANVKRLSGKNMPDIASSIAAAVANHLTMPNMVSCSLVGTVGPVGQINSIVVVGLVPSSMSALMISKAMSKGLRGRDISNICNAVANGVCQSLYSMMMSGSAAGIAVGSGTGQFTGINEQVLSKLIFGQMGMKQLKGRDAIKLADAMAFGIVTHLKTSVKFTLLVTGAIAPMPPVGPLAIASVPSLFSKVS